jgi:hypothetical protein
MSKHLGFTALKAESNCTNMYDQLAHGFNARVRGCVCMYISFLAPNEPASSHVRSRSRIRGLRILFLYPQSYNDKMSIGPHHLMQDLTSKGVAPGSFSSSLSY